MKKLILIMFVIIPILEYAQSTCDIFGAYCCCPIPYEIDLDKDTTYSFTLMKEYCLKDFYGQPSKAYVDFFKESGFSELKVLHSFSVNCCTSETYTINIKNDTIKIAVNSEGSFCTCGACTFDIGFRDLNSTKNQYKIIIANVLDTLISVTSGVETQKNTNSNIKYTFINNKLKIAYNGYYNNYIDIEIFNMNGETIYRKKISSKEFIFDTPKNKGIYILRIWNGIKTETIKIPIF